MKEIDTDIAHWPEEGEQAVWLLHARMRRHESISTTVHDSEDMALTHRDILDNDGWTEFCITGPHSILATRAAVFSSQEGTRKGYLPDLRARVTELLRFNNVFEERARAAERAYKAQSEIAQRIGKVREDMLLEAMYPTPRPIEEWHEDMGPKLWWKFPIEEPPYCGSPLDLGYTVEFHIETAMRTDADPYGKKNSHMVSRMVGGWPGYHTHFTDIPLPKEP